MPKPTVDTRPFSRATLVGRLKSCTAGNRRGKTLRATAMVEVEGESIWLYAAGNQAETLTRMEIGDSLRAEGSLANQEWPRQRAGEGRRLVVVVETVTPIAKVSDVKEIE